MTIERRNAVLLALSLLLCCGCASVPGQAASGDGARPNPAAFYDTRMILGRCENTGTKEVFAPVLIPLVAPLAVEAAKAVTALAVSRAAAKGETAKATYSALASGHFYRLADGAVLQNFSCIRIYRGWFGPSPEKTDSEVWTPTVCGGIGLAAPPDFFFEARLDFSEDATAFKVTPIFLDFASAASSGGKKAKDLLVTYTFEPPAKSLDDGAAAAYGAAAVLVKKAVPGSRLAFPFNGAQNTSQWIPLPRPEGAAKAGEAKAHGIVPFSVVATVKEYSEAPDGLALAAQTLRASGDQINQAVQKAVQERLGAAPASSK